LTAQPPGPQGTALRLRGNLLLASLSTGLLLCLGECGLRFSSGQPLAAPRASGGLHLERIGFPASYDAGLGFVPTPGATADFDLWKIRMTVTDDGLRSNGTPPPRGTPILAVGDSFTFGDDVDDDATWPAQLEQQLGRPVVNGGVFGYGLDQMVLRAERLLDRIPADVLITSIISDDIQRCEFSYRYGWKPYFRVDEGELHLHNVPVPTPETTPVPTGTLNRWIGSSHLALWIARRIDPDRWLLPQSIRVHRQGSEVSRALLERLVRLTRERDVRLLLVLQWHPRSRSGPGREVLDHARELGVPGVRVFPELKRRVRLSRLGKPIWADFFTRSGHMNAEGNLLVAGLIGEELRRLGWVRTGAAGPGNAR
jgi:hypothetical protein